MKTSNVCLVNKTCIPCQGGMPALTSTEIENLIKELEKGWTLNKIGHLYRVYPFNDFQKAMDFANKIAEIAEKEGHHPDLKIAWGKCEVETWTHKINGLTESDFILAAKIERVYKKG